MPKAVDRYPIILRAWDSRNNRMLTDQAHIFGSIASGIEGLIPQQWIGHLDDSPENKMIFLGDICDIEIKNEFGSMQAYMAIVGFNTDKAGYTYDIFNSEYVFSGEIVKAYVKGNIYENRELYENNRVKPQTD